MSSVLGIRRMNYSHQENERDTDDSFSKSLDELQELLLSQEIQRDTFKVAGR
jgi:hypothetical protein